MFESILLEARGRKKLSEDILISKGKGKYQFTKDDLITFLSNYKEGDEVKNIDIFNYMKDKYGLDDVVDLVGGKRTSLILTPKEVEKLLNTKMLYKDGRKFKVAYMATDEDIKVDADKTALKQVIKSTGEKTKLKLPTNTKNASQRFEKLLKTLLVNMKSGNINSKIILVGEPGAGKTSVVKDIADFLKMKLIVIEAPHINENNLISIPYLVKNGKKEQFKQSVYEEDNNKEFKVVNAESNLITQIKQLHKKPYKEESWQKFMNTHKALLPLYKKYERLIDAIREKYDTLIFIDEFYRTGDSKIQNLFRMLMNGHIGGAKIPEYCFFIYASNINNNDGSLDTIPTNNQIDAISFDSLTKDEFMTYIADKLTNTDVETGEITTQEAIVKDDVYNEFMDALTNEDLGYFDEDLEVRVSPRRWEEIIKYISANYPITDLEQVRALKTYLKNSFSDYKTGEYIKELYDRFERVIINLAMKSGINEDAANEAKPFKNTEWIKMLENEVKTTNILGKYKKYVPMVGGNTGIGKTSNIKLMAERLNMNLIVLEASELTADDVSAIPTKKELSDGTIITEFQTPPLYQRIMRDYDPTLKEKFTDAKYTHILFLDEFTRVEDNRVFNAIRKLLLEKEVADKKIPDDILIIGAYNPFDNAGVKELTDHTKDVINPIQSAGDYSKMLDLWKNNEQTSNLNKLYDADIGDIIINNYMNINNKLASSEDDEGRKLDLNEQHFWFTTPNAFDVYYVNPRTQSDLYFKWVSLIDIFKDFVPDMVEDDEKEQLIKDLYSDLKDAFVSIIRGCLLVSGKVDASDLENEVSQFLDIVDTDILNMATDIVFETTTEVQKYNTLLEYYENMNKDFNTMLNNVVDIANSLETLPFENIQNDIMAIIDDILIDSGIMDDKITPDNYTKYTLQILGLLILLNEINKVNMAIPVEINDKLTLKLTSTNPEGDFLMSINSLIDKTDDKDWEEGGVWYEYNNIEIVKEAGLYEKTMEIVKNKQETGLLLYNGEEE